MQDTETIARDAFAAILAQFSALRMVEQPDARVELSFQIPRQKGLRYRVWLNLQNRDELHFAVEHFGLEWFPCTNPDRVAAFISAVTGFLAGESRVLERYRGARCISAELQIPKDDTWHTIGKSSCLSIPLPWRVTYREVRNT